ISIIQNETWYNPNERGPETHYARTPFATVTGGVLVEWPSLLGVSLPPAAPHQQTAPAVVRPPQLRPTTHQPIARPAETGAMPPLPACCAELARLFVTGGSIWTQPPLAEAV